MKYWKILSLVFCTFAFAVNCKAHAGVKHIETKYNVKIGVYAIDTNNGNSFSYRQDEHFPFQSTVKMVVAAAALKIFHTNSLTYSFHCLFQSIQRVLLVLLYHL